MRWNIVLVAIDFSPAAERALRSAERLVAEVGGRLTLVHVVQLPPAYTLSLGQAVPGGLEREWVREATAELERVAKTVEIGEPRREVRVGTPWKEILDVAGDTRADAIALGNAGHSRLERLLLGSTAENVVRRSDVPVLVVREHPLGSVRRVLVPIDFDRGTETALAFIRGSLPSSVEVHAIHVVAPLPPAMPTTGPFTPDLEAIQRDVRALLVQAGVERAVEEVRLDPDPSSTILEAAERHGVDLIVLATHGRRGLPRAFLGSVAEKLVRHAKRPVLVLPGPGRQRKKKKKEKPKG